VRHDGSDDGPDHEANEHLTVTTAPGSTTPATIDDDGPNHDANDDGGHHRGRGGDDGGSNGSDNSGPGSDSSGHGGSGHGGSDG
jgi:hypothetical protein